VQRAPLVLARCLRWLLRPADWGLFWPAFACAAAVVMRAGPARLRALAAAVAAAAAAFASTYLLSTIPPDWHIDRSYTRLLSQLAPAAAVVMAAAYERLRGGDAGPGDVSPSAPGP
jgi:hypothetical protein